MLLSASAFSEIMESFKNLVSFKSLESIFDSGINLLSDKDIINILILKHEVATYSFY